MFYVSGCVYVLHSTAQLYSHRRKHERYEIENNLYDNFCLSPAVCHSGPLLSALSPQFQSSVVDLSFKGVVSPVTSSISDLTLTSLSPISISATVCSLSVGNVAVEEPLLQQTVSAPVPPITAVTSSQTANLTLTSRSSTDNIDTTLAIPSPSSSNINYRLMCGVTDGSSSPGIVANTFPYCSAIVRHCTLLQSPDLCCSPSCAGGCDVSSVTEGVEPSVDAQYKIESKPILRNQQATSSQSANVVMADNDSILFKTSPVNVKSGMEGLMTALLVTTTVGESHVNVCAAGAAGDGIVQHDAGMTLFSPAAKVGYPMRKERDETWKRYLVRYELFVCVDCGIFMYVAVYVHLYAW